MAGPDHDVLEDTPDATLAYSQDAALMRAWRQLDASNLISNPEAFIDGVLNFKDSLIEFSPEHVDSEDIHLAVTALDDAKPIHITSEQLITLNEIIVHFTYFSSQSPIYNREDDTELREHHSWINAFNKILAKILGSRDEFKELDLESIEPEYDKTLPEISIKKCEERLLPKSIYWQEQTLLNFFEPHLQRLCLYVIHHPNVDIKHNSHVIVFELIEKALDLIEKQRQLPPLKRMSDFAEYALEMQIKHNIVKGEVHQIIRDMVNDMPSDSIRNQRKNSPQDTLKELRKYQNSPNYKKLIHQNDFALYGKNQLLSQDARASLRKNVAEIQTHLAQHKNNFHDDKKNLFMKLLAKLQLVFNLLKNDRKLKKKVHHNKFFQQAEKMHNESKPQKGNPSLTHGR